jgi:hypothetical protein
LEIFGDLWRSLGIFGELRQSLPIFGDPRQSSVINIPGVAGVVLKSPLSLTDSLINSSISSNISRTLSIPNQKSYRAEILRECLSITMCHVSGIVQCKEILK